jgi:acyl-CoA thioesterase-1
LLFGLRGTFHRRSFVLLDAQCQFRVDAIGLSSSRMSAIFGAAVGLLLAPSIALAQGKSDAGSGCVARYLALGDSFTAGTGSPPQQAFPIRLGERWRSTGCKVEVLNLGVNGYATRELIEWEIPKVRDFAPTVVTLAVGANDIVRRSTAEEYREHVRRIFQMLSWEGVPGRLVLAIPQPQWSTSPSAEAFGGPELNRQIEVFNAILREESSTAGARYLDLYPLMQDQARAHMLAADGLHPSAEAADAWAAAIFTAAPRPNKLQK